MKKLKKMATAQRFDRFETNWDGTGKGSINTDWSSPNFSSGCAAGWEDRSANVANKQCGVVGSSGDDAGRQAHTADSQF